MLFSADTSGRKAFSGLKENFCLTYIKQPPGRLRQIGLVVLILLLIVDFKNYLQI
jgi:hypothetical protein